MARFYFHFEGPDGLEPDDLGIDLPGPNAALDQARRAAPGILGDVIAQGCDPTTCSFRITTGTGRLVMKVPFVDLLGDGARSRSFQPSVSVATAASAPAGTRSARPASLDLYGELFESLPCPTLILTPRLDIIAANRAYCEATERHADDLLDHNVCEMFPRHPVDLEATDAEGLLASFQRAMSLQVCDVAPMLRYDMRGRDGAWRRRYWRPTNWPIFDGSGAVVAVINQMLELTEQVSGPGGRRPSGRRVPEKSARA
jgi:PAS domain-containing protein